MLKPGRVVVVGDLKWWVRLPPVSHYPGPYRPKGRVKEGVVREIRWNLTKTRGERELAFLLVLSDRVNSGLRACELISSNRARRRMT